MVAQLSQSASITRQRKTEGRENTRKQIIEAAQALIERAERQDPNKPHRALNSELHVGERTVIKLHCEGTVFEVSACKNGRPGRADACFRRNVPIPALMDGTAPLTNFLDLVEAHNADKPA